MKRINYFLKISAAIAILCLSIFALTACGGPEEPPEPEGYIERGTCGADGDGSNLSWELNHDSGIMTISGSGAMANFAYGTGNDKDTPRWMNNQDKVTTIVISEGVTTIGNEAFSSFHNLTSITIPNTITTIGEQAFLNCSNLESIVLPSALTKIGAKAFTGCENLKGIDIPNGVTAISEETFYCCYQRL